MAGDGIRYSTIDMIVTMKQRRERRHDCRLRQDSDLAHQMNKQNCIRIHKIKTTYPSQKSYVIYKYLIMQSTEPDKHSYAMLIYNNSKRSQQELQQKWQWHVKKSYDIF